MLLYFPDSASSRCALELWILKEGWFTEKANSLELACWQKRTSLVEMSWILNQGGWLPVTMMVTRGNNFFKKWKIEILTPSIHCYYLLLLLISSVTDRRHRLAHHPPANHPQGNKLYTSYIHHPKALHTIVDTWTDPQADKWGCHHCGRKHWSTEVEVKRTSLKLNVYIFSRASIYLIWETKRETLPCVDSILLNQ